MEAALEFIGQLDNVIRVIVAAIAGKLSTDADHFGCESRERYKTERRACGHTYIPHNLNLRIVRSSWVKTAKFAGLERSQ